MTLPPGTMADDIASGTMASEAASGCKGRWCGVKVHGQMTRLPSACDAGRARERGVIALESYDGPILDDHLHLDPKGEGPRALRPFKRDGGTHVMVVHKPYLDYPVNKGADFLGSFRATIDLAGRTREETGLGVLAAVGPYPVEYIRLSEALGPQAAEEAMLEGMEAAASLVREGLAHAIGEIGRPHFVVEPRVMEASNRILAEGMKIAANVGCPVVLHTESATPEVFAELGALADRAGLPRDRVIKHFSPPMVELSLNAGLFPSVLASRSSVIEAARQGPRFMMETDFLDDPRRPGAVMGVRTVPKRTHMLLELGLVTADKMYVIHKDNPERLYGVSMDR